MDERSDVFSFGTVLYEMISGRKAFGRTTQYDVLRAIVHEQPPGLRDISPRVPRRVEEIVFSCLKRDPVERPSINAVVAALESASRSRFRKWHFAAAAAILAAAATAAWLFADRSELHPAQLLARPITSYPGHEIGASFSPDGTQIVFGWQRAQDSHFGVYTRALDGVEPKLLTDRDGHHPVWSPSGKEIAFLSDVDGHDSIFVVPAEGGEPQPLVSVGSSVFIFQPALSWSENSQWIAYAAREEDTGSESIFAVAREGGAIHKLTRAKPGESHIQPALSREGNLLAFVVDRDGVSTIKVIKLTEGMMPDGQPQELRFSQLANTICRDPVWRANRELLFVTQKGSLSWLWSVKMDAAGAPASPRLIGNLGEEARMLAVPRSGSRLVFSRFMANENMYAVDVSHDGSGGSQTVLASAYREAWPRYSPDGQRIAFESDRGGFSEIWLANVDGTNAFALTNFHGPVTGSPAWSPDGRQIAFDTRASGEPQVYVMRPEKGAQARRVTTENANFLPAWSADGRILYFVSNRTGKSTIWCAPAEGGQDVQISRSYGFDPQPSLDGKYLYFFADRSQHAPVHRIDLTTLMEEPLVENVMDRGISVTGRGLYFLRRHSDQTTVTLNLFDPSANRDQELRRLFTKMNGGLDMRKDDRAALVTATEFMATDLMLVEDFQ